MTPMSERTSSHLSDSDLQQLRTALGHKRDELIAAARADDPARRGIGDPEAEEGDVAEQAIEQDAALRVGAFDAALLADVERALKKIEDGPAGRYGTSEDSGKPIGLERLKILPWARRTADEEAGRGRAG